MQWLHRLRWPALIILSFGVLYFAFWVWFRVSVYFSNAPRPFLTETATYIAVAPAIFIVTFYVSSLLAALTWRSTTEGRRKWKFFWNFVEIAWLLGGGLSIINLLATQATAIVPTIIRGYEDDASVSRAKVEVFAKQTKVDFCTPEPEDRNICDRVDRLSRLMADPSISDDYGFRLTLDIDQFIRDHHDHPAVRKLEELQWLMFSYGEDMGFIEREKHTRLETTWSKPLALVTPHIFAFVLALRLGRALAAFAL